MKLFVSVLIAVAICGTVALASSDGHWEAVRPNLAQIAFVDAYSEEGLYIGAFVSGPGPFVLRSTDGGQNLTRAVDGVPITLYFDIESVPGTNGAHAVGGGASLLGQSVTIQTHDGQTWQKSNTTVQTSAFMKVQAIDANNVALFGSWSYRDPVTRKSTPGAGVALSSNGGATYTFANWTHLDVPPTSGQVVGSSIYALGSAVPAVPEQPEQQAAAADDLSVPLTFDQLELAAQRAPRSYVLESRAQVPINETYRGFVSKSQDGGKTWTSLLADQSQSNVTGVTYGSLSFASEQVGFVSGANRTALGDYAFVIGTTDGGKTWSTLTSLMNGIFTQVLAISEQEFFVIGGTPNGGALGQSIVRHTTDGGKTFTDDLIDKQLAFIDISVYGQARYAIGVSRFQTASLYKFVAKQ